MTDDFRQVLTTPVCEDTTCQLTLQLKDETGANLAGSQIHTLTLTLYKDPGGAILNGRDGSNIKNTGGGTLSAGGLLTLILSDLDNVLISQLQGFEDHVALLRWTWASGAKSGAKEVTFPVYNQAKMP